MKDIRISIRLNSEEHKKLKIFAIKNDSNIQTLIHDYIVFMLNKISNEKKY